MYIIIQARFARSHPNGGFCAVAAYVGRFRPMKKPWMPANSVHVYTIQVKLLVSHADRVHIYGIKMLLRHAENKGAENNATSINCAAEHLHHA